MPNRLKVGVLVSGSGTNLQSIIDASERGDIDAEVAVVVSNKSKAYALERARRHKIPTVILKHTDYPDRESYDAKIVKVLKEHGVELVALAGFMRIVSPVLIDAFPSRVLNIHPALLPAFPGIDAQAQALQHGVRFSGATVHLVTPEVDAGPIVIQAVVPVLDGDTEETLQQRILKEEHRIYPRAIQLIAEDRIFVEGRRVRLRGMPDCPVFAHLNPP